MPDGKIAGKAKRSSAYAQKLKDPRWQRKRLEIMARDEYTCQMCGDTEETLHVHHKRYVWGNDPWDYSDDVFVTLCHVCHKAISSGRKDAESSLIETLANHLKDADDIRTLAELLNAYMNENGSDFVDLLLIMKFSLAHDGFAQVISEMVGKVNMSSDEIIARDLDGHVERYRTGRG